jgi:acetylglutamate kinase
MKKLHIIKVGGNIIDDAKQLDSFLEKFAAIPSPKILIHGGGKHATSMANALGVEQTIVNGRRITDEKTLQITVMVYAGLINKTIVAKLQGLKCDALGLSGADGNFLIAKKRKTAEIDFGNVGDVHIDGVNTTLITKLLNQGITPVISPITHDGHGNLLNTNADTMATVIASVFAGVFDVSLVFCFEKNGVLLNVNDENSYMDRLNKLEYLKLRSGEIISKGMIPKLDNAFAAIEAGVQQVTICHAKNVSLVETKCVGTKIIS